MSKHPHAKVIEMWPSAAEFARAVTRQEEAPWAMHPDNARAMKRTGIPAHFWQAVVRAIDAAGFEPITYARLGEMAKERAQ